MKLFDRILESLLFSDFFGFLYFNNNRCITLTKHNIIIFSYVLILSNNNIIGTIPTGATSLLSNVCVLWTVTST